MCSSFMLVGVKNGVTVGEVESKHTGEVSCPQSPTGSRCDPDISVYAIREVGSGALIPLAARHASLSSLIAYIKLAGKSAVLWRLKNPRVFRMAANISAPHSWASGIRAGLCKHLVDATLQVEDLMRELTAAGSKALDIPEDEGTLPRLMAYARSVAHYPTAIKEVRTSARKLPASHILRQAVQE